MLHPITSVKDNVVIAIKNARDAFNDPLNKTVQQKLQEAFPGDPQKQEQVRQEIAENLEEAFASTSADQRDQRWFTPRNPKAGLAQSAMNDRALKAAAPSATTGSGGAGAAPALAPLQQFGPLDPEWIECVIDGFKTLSKGKAPFVQHQNLSDFLHNIDDQVVIALVGDWGAHNDAAQKVAQQIRNAKPDIVIHLGDIYYAGQDNEATEALNIWPLADPVTKVIPPGTSFALNGNHEMFCGGDAYFGKVFTAFGQKASYFGLRNHFWQILAFDSAYIEFRLLSPEDAQKPDADARLASQWIWLVDKFKNSSLPTILLSHHEPISSEAQEFSDGQNLRSDFQKFLAAAGRPPFGWFFGHEHLCTIYDFQPDLFPTRGRLIGHGSIPHSPPAPGQQAAPGCFPAFLMNTKANDDGDAVSGFALLKFDRETINIGYINEDGSVFHNENWVASQPT
jgi:hypothetical protein